MPVSIQVKREAMRVVIYLQLIGNNSDRRLHRISMAIFIHKKIVPPIYMQIITDRLIFMMIIEKEKCLEVLIKIHLKSPNVQLRNEQTAIRKRNPSI